MVKVLPINMYNNGSLKYPEMI